ncbi:MAG: hypothetical protein ABJ327_10280 [Litoreibacter sp.]
MNIVFLQAFGDPAVTARFLLIKVSTIDGGTYSGYLFVFGDRRRDQLKIIWWGSQGGYSNALPRKEQCLS